MSLELEQALRMIERNERIEALKAHAVALIDETNGGSEKDVAEAILAALARSHRTLQQKFLSAVKLAIHGYAAVDVDLRNQAARDWATKVASIDNGALRFPRI